jgi:hypothetical protein
MDGCAIVTPAKSENRSHKKDMKEPTKKDDLPMYERKPPPEDIVDDRKPPPLLMMESCLCHQSCLPFRTVI